MKWMTFQDAESFLDMNQAWLEEQEVENSLMLGVAIRLQKHPERIKTQPFLGCVEEDGHILAAAVMTPPHNLILAGQPHEGALQVLSDGFLKQSWSLPGVVGNQEISRAFTSVWIKKAGVSARTGLQTRLYQLDQVILPDPVPGKLRQAQGEHQPLLTRWLTAFQKEALSQVPDQEEIHRQVELMVSEGQLFIWENEGPVSMAASARPTRNGVTVNAVYTPPEQRRKGYASACVAALSQRLLDSGYQFCCLFTDLANPTSNHIYMNLGYYSVCDYEERRFESLPPG